MVEAVVAEDVHRRYGAVTALSGVSLTVERGEVFGLIGPNGAGKTTLIRALTGTTEIDSGTVRLFGDPPSAVDQSRIGVLPQSFRPAERLTVVELLEYYAGLYDSTRPIGEIVDLVGLTDATETRYEHLSGGQQRRLCVGVTMVNEPALLFLDEPTTGIDPSGRRNLWEVIDRLTREGTTVVLTTHDMHEAETLSDRVGLMADGRLIECGPPRDLVQRHGGDNRLIVEGVTAVPRSVADEYRTRTGDGSVTIYGVDPATIGGVVSAFDTAAIEYDSLTWTQPTLEDVYLSVTGERFGANETTDPLEVGR